MNWKNVKLVFLREVRDQLRDRRTLFMVAVLPLLLYPALGVGMTYMTVNFSEQERTVVILGAKDLPPPPLLDPHNLDRFLPEYFTTASDANKLRVITEAKLGQPLEAGERPDVYEAEQEFLKQAVEYRGTLEQLGNLSRSRAAAEEKSLRLTYAGPEKKAELQECVVSVAKLKSQEAELKAKVDLWFSNAPVQVMIVVPTGFATKLEEANRQLANRSGNEVQIDDMPRPMILQNSADEKSQLASRRIREALAKWEDHLRAARLEQAGLPASLSSPVDLTSVDVAAKDDLSANLWSKLFPALLVMMGVTGAFYPAVDLGAGEKERGTMETLLISPARRSEIVMGKFMTVMGFSLSTALLNMLSMGLTGQHVLSVAGGNGMGDVSLPSAMSLMWVIFLAFPLSALFSAMSLALAMFASSSKEGQYYLTPLLMVTMGLTMFCLSPAIEIQPYYSILPVAGPALLLKALLGSGASLSELSVYFLPVIGSSIFYSVVALNWAISLFDREEVLFSQAERFDLGLWIKHILRDKDPVPSRTEAAICFAVIVLTQFAALSNMKPDLGGDPQTRNLTMLLWQTIYLIVTVGLPPVIMAILLTSSVRRTLKLFWPRWQYLALGVVLPVVLQPIAVELIHQLDWFFPKLPAEMVEFMKSLSDPNVEWWRPLLAIAVAPAICEELAFRGFLLSGFQSGRQRSFWTPILLSAVCFGVVHMIAHQVFNAMLLGIVLGLLAVRSRSLVPGVIFHFIFNGMQVLQSRIPKSVFESREMQWLFSVESEAGQTAIRFNAPLLAISGLLSIGLITWLVRSPVDADPDSPQRRFSDLPPTSPEGFTLPENDPRWEQMRVNAAQGHNSL
jgi:sodium transport system permease protein